MSMSVFMFSKLQLLLLQPVMSSWRKHCMLMCMRRQNKDDDATSLDYRHSSLNDVPSDVFTHERTLEELRLDSNHIRDLPRELFYCQSLRYLFISDNELMEIPSMIGSLVHLEQLDISRNGIVKLPDNIGACKNLSNLEASVNPLGKIPEGLTRIVGLVELYLNDAFLESLPNSLGRLSQLKVLELRENHLQTLPNSLMSLTRLCRLDLGTNDFQRLPDVLTGLIGLQELWFDNNRLTEISAVIGSLQQLTFFDASKNNIETIALEIENCVSLTDIHLSTNQLLYLPESIGRLSSVTTLKLNDNCLSSLPFSIGGMVSLTELDVSSNSLQELPIGVGLLRHLRTLYADDNYLSYLPAELGSCLRLTILSLCTNNLSSIPDEIGRIPNLHVLNLRANKLRNLPFGLMKLKHLTALWLADNQTKPLVKLQTESDAVTGQRVLTCYLLPQRTNSVPDDNYDSETGDGFHPSAWEERLERRHIQFEFDDVSLQEHQHLQRTPTPYPKELKRRLECRRDQALSDRLASGGGRRLSGDGVVRGRRSERLNGGRVSADRSVDGRRVRSPLVAERHILLKADKEKHLRDKFRMQHSEGGISTSDHAAGDHASFSGSDSTRKQADGGSSSATTQRISSEEIRSLDRSPQRGAVVRGRHQSDSNTAVKTTSPSQTNITVDNSPRSVEVTSESPEKIVRGQATARSPVQAASDRQGQTRHALLPHAGSRRPSGHVSDGSSRHHGTKDSRSRASTSSTRRSGYVSDTSFTAVVNNAANECLRSPAIEGKDGAAVPQQQNTMNNSEQLDAANNNASQKTFSNQYSDAENNNVGSKLSPRGHAINSSMSQEHTAAGKNSADDGIQIMPYTDFVRSRVAHGLPPPRGVVVRRNGRHVLVPQYVVQHHRQHQARVRSLRRHGYESEDGRIAGRHYSSHGYDSDQYHSTNANRRRHRHAMAGHGYESDIGYRSDFAGYSSSRPGQHHHTTVHQNSSVHSADFGSRDWRYSSDHDVHRQKASSFICQSRHNIPLYECDVRETITEEVMDSEGQPDEQSQLLQVQQWPASVQVHTHSQFTNQSRGNQSSAYPYEAGHRPNKSSSRRRHFEPIEL